MSPSRPVRGGTKDGEAVQRSVTINQTTATASVTACEAEGNSTGASAAVDSTMLPRTCLAHFVDLIKDQSTHQLLRVTPKRGKNKFGGHPVALGPDGFFLCTCLELLIKGVPCRHSILALLDTQRLDWWRAKLAVPVSVRGEDAQTVIVPENVPHGTAVAITSAVYFTKAT